MAVQKLIASSALPATSPVNITTGLINGFALASLEYINCHETPNLSSIQTYLSLKGYAPSSISALPPCESFFQYSSTWSLVVQVTRKETEGFTLKAGPALNACISYPIISKVMMSAVPDGVSYIKSLWVIFEFGKID